MAKNKKAKTKKGTGQSKKPIKKAKVFKVARNINKSLGRIHDKPIGQVTHYYRKIKVAIIKFKKPVKVGARIKFMGATTDFSDAITSMQFDHRAIAAARPNKQVGVKVAKRVREGDRVYLIK